MVGSELQVENYSGSVQLENSSGLCTENDSGELQMTNYSTGL